MRFGTVNRYTFDAKPFGIECVVEGFCVKVVEARPGFPAARFGVKKNDIIMEVDGRLFDFPDDALAFSKDISERELPVTITFKSFKNPGADDDIVEAEVAPEPVAVPPQPEPEPESEPEPEPAFVPEYGFDISMNKPIINHDYVTFSFEILNKMDQQSKTLLYRYSDFFALRNALLLKDQSVGNIPFPGKTLIRSNSLRPEIIEMRKEVLGLWMEKVLNLPQFANAVEINDFLKL